MTDPRVIVLGDALLDVVVAPAGRPVVGGDVPSTIGIGPGGQGANVAVRLARRGVEVRLRCALGDDHAARVVRAALAAEGVEVMAVDAAATGTVAVVLGTDGERTMFSQRATFEPFAPGSGGLDGAAGAAWLVISGYLFLQPDAVELAATVAGTPAPRAVLGCSLPAGQAASWSRAVARARPELVVVNTDEARAVLEARSPAGEMAAPAAPAASALFGCLAVVTRPDGAEAASPEGWSVTVGVPVDSTPVTDTTGAGDAFAAALIHRLLESRSPPGRHEVMAALEEGVALAASVARVPGAQGRVTGERPPAVPPGDTLPA